MELQDAERDVYRPTMVPELETPGNKGTKVIMKEAGGTPPPPPPPELVVDVLPSMSGDPVVGYEMTWTDGTFTGGVDPLTVVSKVRSTADGTSFNDLGSDNPYKVRASDLGLMLQAYSEVTDADGTTADGASGLSGNVARPVLDDYGLKVDGVETPSGDTVTLTGDQAVPLEATEEGVPVYPPKDVKYKWSIRTGGGRLSGATDKSATIYIADAAPSAALVQCTISSNDAGENTQISVEFVVS